MRWWLVLLMMAGSSLSVGCTKPSEVPKPRVGRAGQLELALPAEPLRTGRNALYFSLSRLDERERAVPLANPEVVAHVRFYAERPADGAPDARSVGTYLFEARAFTGTDGSRRVPNFRADIELPAAVSGTLEFVILESKLLSAVIRVPVALAPAVVVHPAQAQAP